MDTKKNILPPSVPKWADIFRAVREHIHPETVKVESIMREDRKNAAGDWEAAGVTYVWDVDFLKARVFDELMPAKAKPDLLQTCYYFANMRHTESPAASHYDTAAKVFDTLATLAR